MPNYVMRTATRDEVDLMIDWAAAEGWNPGLDDAAAFYATDPSGFMIGLLDGESISSISVVKYGDDFGFLGFYIVKPDYRGHGYGLRLWNEGLKHLEWCDVGLDGVPAQEDNYARWCFRLADRNTRYEGVARATDASAADSRIMPLAAIAFADVQAYDDALMPASRKPFLEAWVNLPGAFALGILQDGRLSGYTVLRPCRTGYKFGPLFADDAQLAEALYRAAIGRLPEGTPIYLDVPGKNPAARSLAERYQMQPVFHTARMYRVSSRESIELPLDRWYGVTTFELG
jgi:GNAT superfamily N-acetyltransferase